jgi:NitT/TauT family transport system substrate-binding protein
MTTLHTRRRFLATTALAGAAGLIVTPRALAAEEGPLETTTIRLGKGSLCGAPAYLAEGLLRTEGFTDVGYPDMPPSTADTARAVGRGYVDITQGYASQFIPAIEAGEPITLLAGIHVGCIELFANEGIRGVGDLKGKSVGVQALGSNPHVLLTLIAAQIGLDPVKDIRWVTDPSVKPIERFVDGKIDAFLGFAPEPQELRARHIGRSILNTALDRPWSQYFCCMLAGNREYVRRNPVATKRVLRAFLKAADLCATEPTGAAQQLVDRGFTPRYDYAVEALRDIPYDKWREYDPEDTIRFYALRLHEVGFIKSTPQKIIAENTDWRFLKELKRELKT